MNNNSWNSLTWNDIITDSGYYDIKVNTNYTTAYNSWDNIPYYYSKQFETVNAEIIDALNAIVKEDRSVKKLQLTEISKLPEF